MKNQIGTLKTNIWFPEKCIRPNGSFRELQFHKESTSGHEFSLIIFCHKKRFFLVNKNECTIYNTIFSLSQNIKFVKTSLENSGKMIEEESCIVLPQVRSFPYSFPVRKYSKGTAPKSTFLYLSLFKNDPKLILAVSWSLQLLISLPQVRKSLSMHKKANNLLKSLLK